METATFDGRRATLQSAAIARIMVSNETNIKVRRRMAAHAPLQLERFLPYRLSILSNRVSQAIAREYQQRFGLSMTEWRVMAVLARFDGEGLSASAVVRHTEMDKVAVSRAVTRLAAAGRKVHDAIAPLARAHERSMLAELDDDERRALTRILDKLAPV